MNESDSFLGVKQRFERLVSGMSAVDRQYELLLYCKGCFNESCTRVDEVRSLVGCPQACGGSGVSRGVFWLPGNPPQP